MKAHGAAAVFPVSDVERSLRFYTEVLGFEEELPFQLPNFHAKGCVKRRLSWRCPAPRFRFGHYIGLKYGGVYLHLNSEGDRKTKPLGSGNIYVCCRFGCPPTRRRLHHVQAISPLPRASVVDEVDAYYKHITAREAKTEGEPTDELYGMRDFYCIDPDGNQIGFGMALGHD